MNRLAQPRSRRIAAALPGLLALITSLSVAQTAPQGQSQAAAQPSSRIRPEFRIAARSLVTQPIDRTRLVTAGRAVRPEIALARDLGPHDPTEFLEHVQLVLTRPPERQAAFDAEVAALHRRGDPSYHQWLTPQEIGAQFGPSSQDIAALTQFLTQEGFTVNRVAASGMYLDFSGSLAQLQQTFHTEIHDLQMPSGDRRVSAVRDPLIPEALAPLVRGFLSLNDFPARPTMVHALPPVGAKQAGAMPDNTVSTTEYDVGAQDFYTIYNEGPLLSAGVNGSGITVALIEETNLHHTSDVSTFRSMMAVTPSSPTLTVMHGAGSVTCSNPHVTNTDEEGEAVLDTEWAGSVAPSATLLYMSCASTMTMPGIYLSAEAVIDNNLATTMSLSYGLSEKDDTGDNAFLSDLWEQAAAQGETVVISAGDAGSANTDDQNQSIAKNGTWVNTYASTAYNVAAGGTDFQDYYNQLEDTSFNFAHYWGSSNGSGLSSALSYVAETPWNDTCASSILSFYYEDNTNPNALCSDSANGSKFEATGGGGGGVSTLQPRPAWQQNAVYGMPAQSGIYNARLLPDISLMAGNGIWGHALDYYQSDVSTSLQRAGGTSFVAPQLAGLFALIAQKTGERLGQPNYVLYNMAAKEYGGATYLPGTNCLGSGTAVNTGTTTIAPSSTCIFYDITTSNISQACTAGSPNCYTSSGSVGILSTSTTSAQPAYAAGEGFDLATGIGSFNIANLVNNWQNAADGGIEFAPAVALNGTASSFPYGHPASITYTATVSGPGSFPTGSVNFSGSGAIGSIGNGALAESSGCSTGGTCTESTTHSYTAPGTLAGGTYTITATYLTTNENYTTGTGTTTLTVTQQTPTVSVSAVTIGIGTPTANLSATVSYTGAGAAPSGGLTFQVDSGAIVAATCSGSSSPLSCSYTGYNTASLLAGPHTITTVSLADGNYTSASGTATLTVLPAPTITFTVANHHTQDQPFTVSASSNSSGAITYSVVSGPAAIAGNTVTLTGIAGTVTLQASQAQSASYAAGTQDASFQVIAGSVWFANSTGSLSTFDLTGVPITGSSGYSGAGEGSIAPALGLAFDASGNVWVASSSGVSEFSRQGVPITSTAITSGGIANPVAIIVDGAGQVWLANSGGTVSVLTAAGVAVSPSSGYTAAGAAASGIAVDISGSVWVPNSSGNTVTRLLGAAAPVVPLATAASSGAGVEP